MPGKIGGENYNDFIPNEEPLIEPKSEESPTLESLPNDVLQGIFSNLGKEDLKTTASLNKGMKEVSEDTARRTQNAELKEFASFLYTNLDEMKYPTQKNEVLKLMGDTEIFKQNTLVDIKDFALKQISGEKNSFLSLLKTLDDNDIKQLKAAYKYANPEAKKELADIFTLARYTSKLDSATKLEDLKDISKALDIITTDMVKNGFENKAIEYSQAIPNAELHDLILMNISQLLFEMGDTDKAISVSETFHSNESSQGNIRDIGLALISKGQLSKALEVNSHLLIPNGALLDTIYEKAKETHNDKMVAEAEKLITPESKEFIDGTREFRKTKANKILDNFENELQKTIDNDQPKEKEKTLEALKVIIGALVRHGGEKGLQKAAEILNLIEDPEGRFNVLSLEIIGPLMDSGKITESLKFIEEHSKTEQEKNDLLFEVISTSILTTSQTVEISNQITDGRKWFGLNNVGYKLLKLGDIDSALELAFSIPVDYPFFKPLYDNIFQTYYYLDQDKAVELPERLPEEERLESYNEMIIKYTFSGDYKFANKLFLNMNSDLDARLISRHNFSQELIDNNQHAKAIALAKVIENKEERRSVLKDIVSILKEKGLETEAKALENELNQAA